MYPRDYFIAVHRHLPPSFHIYLMVLCVAVPLYFIKIISVQFSHSVVPNSFRPHGLQHARPPCPSPTSGVYSNSCPLSQRYHPTISSCRPLLLLPPIPPSIRVFSNVSALCMRWPKYWSSSFSISPSNGHSGLISFGLTGWISLQSKGLSRVSNTTAQKHQFFGAQLSSQIGRAHV